MIIHLDGKAEELLEFVKGMQFLVAIGFCEAPKEVDDRVETEKEVEHFFTEMKKRKEEPAKPWSERIEMRKEDWIKLQAEAYKREMSAGELIGEIVTCWLRGEER